MASRLEVNALFNLEAERDEILNFLPRTLYTSDELNFDQLVMSLEIKAAIKTRYPRPDSMFGNRYDRLVAQHSFNCALDGQLPYCFDNGLIPENLDYHRVLLSTLSKLNTRRQFSIRERLKMEVISALTNKAIETVFPEVASITEKDLDQQLQNIGVGVESAEDAIRILPNGEIKFSIEDYGVSQSLGENGAGVVETSDKVKDLSGTIEIPQNQPKPHKTGTKDEDVRSYYVTEDMKRIENVLGRKIDEYVIEHLKDGDSLASLSNHLGINYFTLVRWLSSFGVDKHGKKITKK